MVKPARSCATRLRCAVPKNDKFLVDKVPVVRCPHCHQTYMTAQTAKTLDQLLQQRKELARPQTLDVIEFA